MQFIDKAKIRVEAGKGGDGRGLYHRFDDEIDL